MKAIAGELPANDRGWWFEVKWDGMRIVAEVTADDVVLRSARGTDVTVTFPELDDLRNSVGEHAVVLDGEVVAFDEAGRPSFAKLQHRMHVMDRRDAAKRANETPVVLMLFDILWLDGVDLTRSSTEERRALLTSTITPSPRIQIPASFEDGASLLEAARAQGLEGVVAKRIERPYQPGKRSPDWRKVKVRNTQEFVVGGWLGGSGTRAGTIGSLVIGCHVDGILTWVGNVGTGFSTAELRRLSGVLAALATDDCPFASLPENPTGRSAHWVRPEVVVQVEFGEWTPDRRLRHPVYLGERDDKPAADVTCDP